MCHTGTLIENDPCQSMCKHRIYTRTCVGTHGILSQQLVTNFFLEHIANIVGGRKNEGKANLLHSLKQVYQNPIILFTGARGSGGDIEMEFLSTDIRVAMSLTLCSLEMR